MRCNTPRLAAGKNARSAFRSSGDLPRGIMPNIYFPRFIPRINPGDFAIRSATGAPPAELLACRMHPHNRAIYRLVTAP